MTSTCARRSPASFPIAGKSEFASLACVLNTRDFLLEMTISQPLYLLRSMWPTDIYNWRSLKDGEYKNSCRIFQELEEVIEGSPWVETGAGSRLALKNVSSHTQKRYKLKLSTLPDDAVYRGTARRPCELWDVERRAGRVLLFTREVKGFPNVEPLERELLEDEGGDDSDSDEDDYD